MTTRETFRSGSHLLWLRAASLVKPSQFHVLKSSPHGSNTAAGACIDPALTDPQGWDSYWEEKDRPTAVAYEMIAAMYRLSVIKPRFERAIFRNFSEGSRLLHAGCGSGQVDTRLHARMRITAIDISPSALRVYQRNNPAAYAVRHANILDLSFPAESFDGVYNLGVLEHFTLEEIRTILGEFYRVLKPGGRLVIFWPHARATSVAVLKGAHWMMNDVLKKPVQFHPAEISLLESQSQARELFRSSGFRIVDYTFGPRDMFIQAVIAAKKTENSQ
jgi:ubiquinone/menaquinone biosynthesis C-methylase UbiE